MLHFTKDEFRHEQKYRITTGEYQLLKHLLVPLMKVDPNAFDDAKYAIRSIYFDDEEHRAFHANAAGILPRKKFRIRVYNCDSNQIKLEEKIKVSDYITKNTSILNVEEYHKIMTGDLSFLLDGDDVRVRFYSAIRKYHLRPLLIVDYVREAYYFPYGNVRITFDQFLRYAYYKTPADLFDSNLLTRPVETELLIEVKYDHYIPTHLKEVLSSVGSNQVANSKYYLCHEAMF